MPEGRAPWYVVQVTAGREERMRALVEDASELEDRAAGGRPVLRACFVPKARVGVKREGKWRSGEEVLMPGYLVAETERPERLDRALRRIDGFARVVRQGDVFVPLSEEESRWLAEQTGGGRYAVDMSEGYVEGGRLHVTAGPLVGREAQVVKVDHRRKVAYLELEAFGRTVRARVGMRVLGKRRCIQETKTN